MKSFKVLFLVIVSGVLISLSGCKKPDPTPPTPEEVQLGMLSQTWKVNKVTLDGTDKTSDYSAFTLVISGNPGASDFKYTTSGRPATSPWLANGNLVFGVDVLSDIIRDKGSVDEKAMVYKVTENQLQLSFDFSGSGYPGARTSIVKGKWFFEFKL